MEFIRTGIHGFHETIGLDVDELRVYWALKGKTPETRQVAYRIVVAEDKGALELGRVEGSSSSIACDSGRVNSNAQRNILVKPENGFKSTTLYFWQVSVWDQDGVVSRSEIAEFYTSYPRCSRLLPPYSMNQTYMPHTSLIFRAWFEDEPNRWKAVWIGDGGDKPIYLRKSITTDGHHSRAPSRVFVFASGLGHFNLTINGRPASEHVLDPGWTNYHRTVQFVGYDVTGLWRGDGDENVVGAHVGNGFYAGDKGGGDRFFWPTYEDNTYVRYGNELCFFAEVHLHYPDGGHEVVVSDPSWKVRRSATTLANIYSSEDCDLRAIPVGWDMAGFDDEGWDAAKPVTGPRGKIRYQSQPPVVLHETFEPVATKTLRRGVVSFDLGQNASIMVRLEATGRAGQEVIVRFSETVDEEGYVLMPDPLFKQFETGVYHRIILAGTGEREVWSPGFSFTSARYVQIEGVSLDQDESLPIIHSLTARHISSAARHLGYVKTDKADVNALINACYWTFSSNLFSYHTDCPQVEKFGWLEVSSLLFPATQYVRDMEALYAKILDDVLDAQESNGLVPTMAPEMRYMAGPLHDTISWGCAIAFLPEMLKRYYGWTGTFEKVYDGAIRYMEYIRGKERHGGLIEHGLGDWGIGIAFGNHQANIETAIYYKCLRNVAMMAEELGRDADAVKFSAWADRIYSVYNKRLLVTDKKEYPYAHYTSLDDPGRRDRTMVAQAIALQLDLVPQRYRADIYAAFVAAAEASGHVMRAGELGLKYLWNSLADPAVDCPDIVLDMCRQEEHPSYMRFLRRGETTLSEFWQDECRSKCHDMLGTIYEWFYEYVLGVRVKEDGYRVWSLRPPVRSEFGMVEGCVECPYGRIKVVYRKDGSGRVTVEVEVPTSTRCIVEVAGEERMVVVRRRDEGRERKTKAKEVDIGPGEYLIEIEPERASS